MARVILIIALFISSARLSANQLELADLRLESENSLSIDISWQNSWHLPDSVPPANHDAVWLFAKVQTSEGWFHLDLDRQQNPSFSDGTEELSIDVSLDQKGAFIKRSRFGTGDIQPERVTLSLAQPLTSDRLQLKVFGIEMVYVAESAFYAGDGWAQNALSSHDGTSFLIESENEIVVGELPGQLTGRDKYLPAGDVPQEYPKGFEAFYCMKYEISQQQYAEFLNTLDLDQQSVRSRAGAFAGEGTWAMSSDGRFRSAIKVAEPADLFSNETAVYKLDAGNNIIYNQLNDGQNRAANFLLWSDLTAYLDWAALRPMTELEYEKAARGPLSAVQGEFAWGTRLISDANTVVFDGTDREAVTDVIAPGSGMANHGNFRLDDLAALRCGFAATDSSNRLESGSSYYGIKELSGNLWEQVINLSEPGLAFTGEFGDGELASNGDSDVSSWCATTGDCAGHKGGGWNSGIQDEFRDLAVSDRFFIYLNPNLTRRNTVGGRGVR